MIRGNAAIMKCEIPSYVSDFIVVDMWTDSDGGSYYPQDNNYGTPHTHSNHFGISHFQHKLDSFSYFATFLFSFWLILLLCMLNHEIGFHFSFCRRSCLLPPKYPSNDAFIELDVNDMKPIHGHWSPFKISISYRFRCHFLFCSRCLRYRSIQ